MSDALSPPDAMAFPAASRGEQGVHCGHDVVLQAICRVDVACRARRGDQVTTRKP
jgi:hypothetical protein